MQLAKEEIREAYKPWKAGIFFLLDKEFPLSRNDGKNITLAHEPLDFKRNC